MMDNGFLRYEISLEKPDGEKKVLREEATAHEWGLIENRHSRLIKLGHDVGKLRVRVSKVI